MRLIHQDCPQNHHPPHDHPDIDAYLDSLTEDDIAAINDTILQTTNQPPDSAREATPDNKPTINKFRSTYTDNLTSSPPALN